MNDKFNSTISNQEILFLNVPYAEKDQAKALGARWDPQVKKWYISSQRDYRQFSSWLPSSFLSNNPLLVHADEYIAPELSPITYDNLGISDFVILDTETTGLTSDDEIVELSIIDEAGKELYHSFFKSEKPIDWAASKVNGITNAMLKSSPLFSGEWNNIKRTIGTKRVCGYNTEFDYRLICQTLFRYNLNTSEASTIFANYIDVLKFARQYIKAPKYNLQTISRLCRLLGIKDEQKHRATYDCLMTLLVLRKIENLVPEMKP